MFFCVDRRNVVTGLTYSITEIRQMTIKNIALPQSCAAGDLNRVQIGWWFGVMTARSIDVSSLNELCVILGVRQAERLQVKCFFVHPLQREVQPAVHSCCRPRALTLLVS
jgi:hypothetical protein